MTLFLLSNIVIEIQNIIHKPALKDIDYTELKVLINKYQTLMDVKLLLSDFQDLAKNHKDKTDAYYS